MLNYGQQQTPRFRANRNRVELQSMVKKFGRFRHSTCTYGAMLILSCSLANADPLPEDQPLERDIYRQPYQSTPSSIDVYRKPYAEAPFSTSPKDLEDGQMYVTDPKTGKRTRYILRNGRWEQDNTYFSEEKSDRKEENFSDESREEKRANNVTNGISDKEQDSGKAYNSSRAYTIVKVRRSSN